MKMVEREMTSSIETIRLVLFDADKHNLIEPRFAENFAAKKCVNVANSVLENARLSQKVCTRDIVVKMNVSESTSRNYLVVLHELGYLDKERAGKGFVYRYKYTEEEF